VSTAQDEPRLGLRANLTQFCLLVAVNALVGGMVGQEQTVLPLLAKQQFHLTGYVFLLTYVLAFGITKAATNYFAGTWSDRFGRKPVLVVGWLIAIPVPLLLIWAPSWGWVIVANILLGINQGLTWSTTVVMKIDLVGPRQRGLAMGFNEAAGYGAVALTAVVAAYLAAQYGLRPAPFLLGLSYALIGLGVSAALVRETRGHAHLEATHHGDHHDDHVGPTNREIFSRTSFSEPALSSACLAGLVNNLNFGLSWGLFPLLFATTGTPVDRIGVLVATYPAVWGAGQILTGALSDRWGRKHLITAGMLTKPPLWPSSRPATLFPCGCSPARYLAREPPWSIPPCWPRSAMSRTPLAGPRRRGLPILARHRLRRGRRRRRPCRRPVGVAGRRLGCRGDHRGLGSGRRDPHV
jgi:MFS family permease